MTIATIIIRIWRRHRRHYLSAEELARQPDLTTSEAFLLFALKEKAEGSAVSDFAGRMGRQFALEHGVTCARNQGSEYCECKGGIRPVQEADLVSSEIVDSRRHMPVLDIDLPCRLVESSPGKFHLYIDKPMPWPKMVALGRVMAACGIIEQGYFEACAQRGYFSVRHPDRLKGTT